jgi:hypothetical protein
MTVGVDEMMSYPRLYNAAGVTACKPVLIQPILMSIIFQHYKQLDTIKNKTKSLYRVCDINNNQI